MTVQWWSSHSLSLEADWQFGFSGFYTGRSKIWLGGRSLWGLRAVDGNLIVWVGRSHRNSPTNFSSYPPLPRRNKIDTLTITNVHPSLVDFCGYQSFSVFLIIWVHLYLALPFSFSDSGTSCSKMTMCLHFSWPFFRQVPVVWSYQRCWQVITKKYSSEESQIKLKCIDHTFWGIWHI